ncbi:hypothetical protein MRX96_045601 [Rhipicephalus microplus]
MHFPYEAARTGSGRGRKHPSRNTGMLRHVLRDRRAVLRPGQAPLPPRVLRRVSRRRASVPPRSISATPCSISRKKLVQSLKLAERHLWSAGGERPRGVLLALCPDIKAAEEPCGQQEESTAHPERRRRSSGKKRGTETMDGRAWNRGHKEEEEKRRGQGPGRSTTVLPPRSTTQVKTRKGFFRRQAHSQDRD